MVVLPLRRRHAPRLSLVQGLALLYGHTLHLPPAALPARTYPDGHPIVAGLRPFRVRLHLQRATVTALRALALAALAAIGILLVRLSGSGMPLLTPLLGAGVVFVAALCTILWQRPSTPQMAHALDRRLGLREQIGSALELESSSSRLAALLSERATTAIANANPAYILPWPSLRRERRSLIVLGLLTGLCALLAAHAPPPRQLAAVPSVRVSAARRSSLARHAPRAHALPIKLLALGTAPHGRPTVAGRPTGALAAHLSAGRGQGGRAQGRQLAGNALSVHATRGPGQGSPVSGSGSRGGANPLGSGRLGRAAGRSSVLHLTSGKNSAAGGVTSPQQQALLGLQNSISSAQAQQGGQVAPTSGPQGVRRNTQGQYQPNGNTGPRGLGHGRATGQGRSSAHGQNAGATASRPGTSSSSGRYTATARRPGYGSADDPTDPYGRHGSGSGTGPQSASPSNNASAAGRSAARLAGDQGITLNGAPGAGGRLIVSQGLPNRAPGVNGSSLYGAPGGVSVTVPGYVAPDSNTIAPDERGLIRQYFSPPTNNQGY